MSPKFLPDLGSVRLVFSTLHWILQLNASALLDVAVSWTLVEDFHDRSYLNLRLRQVLSIRTSTVQDLLL
jgi:hypothetical protein